MLRRLQQGCFAASDAASLGCVESLASTLASDSTQPSGGITSSDGLVHFELGRNKLVRNKLERNKLEINSVLIKFDIA